VHLNRKEFDDLTSKEHVAAFSVNMLLLSFDLREDRGLLSMLHLHPSPTVVNCCFRPKSYTL
jgi:hypothetical protein